MNNVICTYCGSDDWIEKHVEYVYRHRHHYMVFRDVPAEVCRQCGMRYFTAAVLLVLERRFFAIYAHESVPQQTVMVPVETFMQPA